MRNRRSSQDELECTIIQLILVSNKADLRADSNDSSPMHVHILYNKEVIKKFHSAK